MVTNPSDRDRPQSTGTGGGFAVLNTAQRRIQICQHTACLKKGSAALLQA
ncbi:MAG: (2Fe-2S) ferredoxin domain-containing protein [Leptolyngbya sp. SIOISBB]|nr:(2Fe-2S) ferredoxin domain-containing protein [Leptolyngbya sp. SIOISBB]